MHFFFEISVPKKTSADNPHTEKLRLTKGVITDVFVYIPRGHAGLAALKMLYHDHQLYPLNPGGAYRGNETTIAFSEYQPIIVDPFELKAVAYNDDDTYAHSFFLGLAVQRPEEMGREIPSVSTAALMDLINATSEAE